MVDKGKFLENFAGYTLVILLVLSFLGSVFVSAVNPEVYFFGQKLAGEKAVVYLLIRGTLGIGIAFTFLKKKSEGAILSVLYFGYLFHETSIANISLGYHLSISPLSAVGLAISLSLLIAKRIR